jgi:hypothetical protein
MNIAVVVDTSASMRRRTALGVSLLDLAKSGVEALHKRRAAHVDAAADRWHLVTCGTHGHGALSLVAHDGWDPSGSRGFLAELKALDALDPDRLHDAIETAHVVLGAGVPRPYGKGRDVLRSAALCIVLTDCTATRLLLRPLAATAAANSAAPEAALHGPSAARWNHRVYGVALRLVPGAGVSASVNALDCVCRAQGGGIFVVRTKRGLLRSIAAIERAAVRPAAAFELTCGAVCGPLAVYPDAAQSARSVWPLPEPFVLCAEHTRLGTVRARGRRRKGDAAALGRDRDGVSANGTSGGGGGGSELPQRAAAARFIATTNARLIDALRRSILFKRTGGLLPCDAYVLERTMAAAAGIAERAKAERRVRRAAVEAARASRALGESGGESASESESESESEGGFESESESESGANTRDASGAPRNSASSAVPPLPRDAYNALLAMCRASPHAGTALLAVPHAEREVSEVDCFGFVQLVGEGARMRVRLQVLPLGFLVLGEPLAELRAMAPSRRRELASKACAHYSEVAMLARTYSTAKGSSSAASPGAGGNGGAGVRGR